MTIALPAAHAFQFARLRQSAKETSITSIQTHVSTVAAVQKFARTMQFIRENKKEKGTAREAVFFYQDSGILCCDT